MIMNGRYAVLYEKLAPELQRQVLARIVGLIEEDKEYADKGNYGHLCNILPTIVIDDVLQRNGKTVDEAFEMISTHMWAALWAALLGVPLPLCSCGVIPTAIGLRNEKASKGAVASFLIATPQTGIDSILATFSLMGLGFAIIRPVAALITGVCGGLLVNRLVPEDNNAISSESSCRVETGNKIWRVLKYAYYSMIQDIGGRLIIGLLVAALIQVAIPDGFFLHFGSQPLLQMLVILIVAVPMHICSTGSIPVAAALIMKGLSPGAALVMLMAGPAVNLASILVVRKAMGKRFTWIYLLVIVGFAIFFGLLVNAIDISVKPMAAVDPCCNSRGSDARYVQAHLCHCFNSPNYYSLSL